MRTEETSFTELPMGLNQSVLSAGVSRNVNTGFISTKAVFSYRDVQDSKTEFQKTFRYNIQNTLCKEFTYRLIYNNDTSKH